ncbi:SDR family oxidoreductase [Listeria welshimeri]|uniref:3-ketoacyl-acyl carrier protein reductase, putative n=1 Tax=Listeria welshimeri serovar 6b (strain ATCC 35897 / DSM 20650 / CCUG 15529 / CIP 8149 / NCTC 11857 / SLCC 5334 / V8) TaxID=386043 RepID=A0AIJ6_LISW6|nr:SDR family oxidoreductase [Listeria welshimeri]MBC1243401.1 SDR family oxidoreductase [Listeria welshimeri]MBC1251890.1 SDR family oxidoreductase [Listeria welshimeri]MBC1281722.1 SDR family oxidoreductase [Listeria welshimeri]MBC1354196.1 SDR family oxidoreductase [Listeria welshimeri]MBC1411219.1 SDR family oxidoreductase [Listeria welshimeri]
MDKETKYAFVTGASGEIGQAICIALAKAGWNLYLHYYQNRQAVEDIVPKLQAENIDVILIQADFDDFSSLKEIEKQVFQVDAFIHAAGHSHYALFQDTTDLDMTKLWNVHMYMPMRLIQIFIPKLMKSQQGRIVFISSIWGEIGASMEVVYSTVKGAQIAFCKALSQEVGLSGITVNAVTPGVVKTKMMDQFSLEEKEILRQEIPLKRFAKPEEIAETVEFLTSKKASYITGEVLRLNGGWLM